MRSVRLRRPFGGSRHRSRGSNRRSINDGNGRHTRTARRRPLSIALAISVASVVSAGSVLVDAHPSWAKGAASTLSIVTVAGAAAGLGSPQSAALDPHGNLIIADENNNVVKVMAASTGVFYGQSMVAGGVYT